MSGESAADLLGDLVSIPGPPIAYDSPPAMITKPAPQPQASIVPRC